MKYLLILVLIFYTLCAKDILGRTDKFSLPELNMHKVKAKIDTGAKTSSLGCISIELLNENYVRFSILSKKDDLLTEQFIVKPVSRISNVKSSNGTIEKRYFIKTKILIFDKTYNIELSLSSRDEMKFPLLIGRELLMQNFMVDVSKQNLSYKFLKNTTE